MAFPAPGSAMSQPMERRFIRHASRIPIRFDLDEDEPGVESHYFLRNVSDGGVCFVSGRRLPLAFPICLHIPVSGEEFEVTGNVAWCRASGRGFEVGVAFDRLQDRFTVRMVEQVCHIQDYRAQVEREEGRTLTSEQAAAEWVDRFAGDFPQ
jgi:hypothetical protein